MMDTVKVTVRDAIGVGAGAFFRRDADATAPEKVA